MYSNFIIYFFQFFTFWFCLDRLNNERLSITVRWKQEEEYKSEDDIINENINTPVFKMNVWDKREKYFYQILSNLYIKANQVNQKMWPLWDFIINFFQFFTFWFCLDHVIFSKQKQYYYSVMEFNQTTFPLKNYWYFFVLFDYSSFHIPKNRGWFCWKYQYNTYMSHFNDHLHCFSCELLCSLLCPGVYNTVSVKIALDKSIY
jgi:hypothetical protein